MLVSFWAIDKWLRPQIEDRDLILGVNLGAAIGGWALLMFVFLYYYIGYLHIWVMRRRQRLWDEKWTPALVRFMGESG